MLAVVLLFAVATGGLAACGDDDDDAAVVPTPSRLPDPCRLISATQLRLEFGVDFSVQSADETPPSEEEVTELSCSWRILDPEVESSFEYLEEDVPTFIDVVIRRSGPDGSVDAVMDEVSNDPGAVELPELVATGENITLADTAVAIGGTVFVMKGDVLLTVSTDSADTLDQLTGEVLERVIARI